MGITTSVGLFSGINTADMIEKLMAVERRPLNSLMQRKSGYETQISAFGELSSVLSEFQSALSDLRSTSLPSLTATSTDDSILTASAGTTASEGQFQITVNSIAQEHKIYSQAFSAESDTVGTGTLTIQVGSNDSVDITIDSTHNTLSDIKDAINDSGINVSATILNDGTGYRLIVSSKDSGVSNEIKISVADDDGNNTDINGLSVLAYEKGITKNMTESQAAQDAQLIVDGLTVTRSSNTLIDLITGITINLKKDSAGQTVNLSIEKDTEAMREKLDAFVTAYNNAMTKAQELSASNGKLSSDSSVDNIIRTLRGITLNNYDNNMLIDFGITHDKNGLLQIDEYDLTNVMENDMDAFINSMNGMAISFDNTTENIIDTIIPSRESAYEKRIDRLEDDEERLMYRLDKKEEALVRKFTILEQTIAQLQSSGDFLTSQLSNIGSE